MLARTNILDDEQIASFFALEEVQAAKRQIDARTSGSVYFTVDCTDTIKTILKDSFGLELLDTKTIPMRWIKGDIAPHVDVGKADFDTTHLLYLTDSPGQLMVDGESYPITKGSAYSFPESSRHETIHTGSEPRLLLGPMSEEGFAVGRSGIFGDGGTTAYFRQNGANYEWSADQISWNTIDPTFNLPIPVYNTDTSGGIFTLEFVSDVSFNVTSGYFICDSSGIQFGSTSLNEDGSRPVITIDGVSDYPGLIQNGTVDISANSGIGVFNLVVDVSNGSTLANDGGWLGQEYFGRDASDNYVINCSSSGPISDDAGGIVGVYAGSGAGAILTIIGCSSSGEISDSAGGIAGRYAGDLSGSIYCESCWSTGFIDSEGGGITGQDTANATIRNCYSTGEIDGESGGICGQDCVNSTITGCYSTGVIGYQAGGIVGERANNVTVSNCYSLGRMIDPASGGIIGPTLYTNTITNCYTVGDVSDGLGYIIGASGEIPPNCFSEALSGEPGTWSSANADTVLDISGEAETWIYFLGTNQPYELLYMGYSPYTRVNIDLSMEYRTFPFLTKIFGSSVTAGANTDSAIVANKNYTILAVIGDNDPSSITMDASSGVISTTAATVPGLYRILIRNTGSYNISVYILTVLEGGATYSCCDLPTFKAGPNTGYAEYTDLRAGNIMMESTPRKNLSYDQLMTIRKAQSSKK
jgi:hypothetical protein